MHWQLWLKNVVKNLVRLPGEDVSLQLHCKKCFFVSHKQKGEVNVENSTAACVPWTHNFTFTPEQ